MDMHTQRKVLSIISQTTFNVSHAVIHPKFNDFHNDYDVMMVKLGTPAKLGGYVFPACVAQDETGVLICVTFGAKISNYTYVSHI